MISVSCLIPAAGLGKRFQKSASGMPPKLELSLGSQTLLERTLSPFLTSPYVKEIILAVPPNKNGTFKKCLEKLGRKGKRIKLVAGGKTRTDSVYQALVASNRKIPWVIVHDAARPLLTSRSLESFLEQLGQSKALVLGRPLSATIKDVTEGRIQRTVPRDSLWAAETPQGFRKEILMKA